MESNDERIMFYYQFNFFDSSVVQVFVPSLFLSEKTRIWALFQFPTPLVKFEKKAVQKLFTRHFACEKYCKILFTCSRWHVSMQFITWKVILNKFSYIKFPKKIKGGNWKRARICSAFTCAQKWFPQLIYTTKWYISDLNFCSLVKRNSISKRYDTFLNSYLWRQTKSKV